MQTFLPYKSFSKSAKALDNKRLWKQILEAKQIYLTMTGKSSAWKNHPIVKMWKPYPEALKLYIEEMLREWLNRRGFHELDIHIFRKEGDKIKLPEWLGNRKFHLSHKSNLLRKDPGHYKKFFPNVKNNIPYEWII